MWSLNGPQTIHQAGQADEAQYSYMRVWGERLPCRSRGLRTCAVPRVPMYRPPFKKTLVTNRSYIYICLCFGFVLRIGNLWGPADMLERCVAQHWARTAGALARSQLQRWCQARPERTRDLVVICSAITIARICT